MIEAGRDRVDAETDMNSPVDAANMRRARVRGANPAVQEAIRVAIQRLSKDGRAGVTKKHVLKTLFLAKKLLPDDNQVKLDLAYYWYMEGPYSEVICANFDKMVENGIVKRRITPKSETYQLAPNQALRPVATSTDLDAVRHQISLVASAHINMHDAIQRAYETAPFKWYTTYNLEFGPKLESHLKDILADRESRYRAQDILERLDDAVLDYPTDRVFMGHRAAFMDYAKMLNAFLRWDSYRTRKDMVNVLHELCGRIWTVFARGVRIHQHDSYYDDRVEAWEVQYKQELAKLDHTVRKWLKEFDKVVVEDVELDPDIVEMMQHPEKYKFKPWVPRVVTRDG